MQTSTFTATEQRDYDNGRKSGRSAYRGGLSYQTPGFEPAEDQGYADGWSAAADEAEAKYGRAFACELSWRSGGVARYESAAK